MRSYVNACECTRGCTDSVRESALKVDSGRKIPCRTGESNLRRQFDGPMLYQLIYLPTLFHSFQSCSCGLTFVLWGCYCLCLTDLKNTNQPSLPNLFYSVLLSVSVFMVFSTVFHFIYFSRRSGLITALLVLSTRNIIVKVSFSSEITPSA